MDKRNIEATKKALLDATAKLIAECKDPSEVTSRAITKEAGVNLAMINYCYGSREALLLAVYEEIQEDVFRCNPYFAQVLTGELSPKEKLIEVHIESMKMMLKHHKFAKVVVKYILLNRELSAKRGSLGFVMEHFNGEKSENECRLIAHEISSLHELAIIRYEELKDTCGIDLADEEQLRKYVTEHIDMFLSDRRT